MANENIQVRPVIGLLSDAAAWALDKVGDLAESAGLPGGDVINTALDGGASLLQGDVGGAVEAGAELLGIGGGAQAPAPAPALPDVPMLPAGAGWAGPVGGAVGGTLGRTVGGAVGGPTGALVGQAVGSVAGSALGAYLGAPNGSVTIQPAGPSVTYAPTIESIQASMGMLSEQQMMLLAAVGQNWAWLAPNLWRVGIGPKGLYNKKCRPLMAKLNKSERNAIAALACGAPELLNTKAEEAYYLLAWAAVQTVMSPEDVREAAACECSNNSNK